MPMPARAALCGSSLSALLAALPALAQDAPVRTVTLFEAGLAEFTHETGTATTVTLSMPLRDVNDVLKSLLLRGTGVERAAITLDGMEPVADAFASLPFPPEAATDLVALLRAVPGLRVRVSDRAYPDSSKGTLMGVHDDCAPEGGCDTILTILHDDGTIRRHVFGDDLQLVLLDPAITEALARGLGALREAASGTTREVILSIEGTDIRNGALSYVIAAPAWKTAYRALTGSEGTVDLQAWAVIENATGENWEDVSLTLSSGSPRTLTADLHGRNWRYREQVASGAGFDGGVAQPVVVAEPAPSFAADAFEEAEGGRGAAPVAPARIAAQAEGEEGVLDSRFSFPDPVDLAAGEMLSLPFLTGALEARHLSVWEGALLTRTGNPEMMLEVTNDLPVRLPAGIMTVSDEEGGYVGDADFPLVAPGEAESVPYGLDRRLRVEETASETTRQVSVRAAEGVVVIKQEQVREARYVVTSPSGEAREAAIDHPVEQGWRTEVAEGPAGEERQDDDGRRWQRFVLLVPGDEGATLRVRHVYPFEQTVAIGTLDEAAILIWSGQAATDKDRAYLQEAARRARVQAQAAEALARAETEGRSLVVEQDRIRRLLGSVQNPSEAYDRFLADLLALEDRIGAATEVTEAARTALAEAQDAFRSHLAGEGGATSATTP